MLLKVFGHLALSEHFKFTEFTKHEGIVKQSKGVFMNRLCKVKWYINENVCEYFCKLCFWSFLDIPSLKHSNDTKEC